MSGIQPIHTSHKWQPEDEESEATSKQVESNRYTLDNLRKSRESRETHK